MGEPGWRASRPCCLRLSGRAIASAWSRRWRCFGCSVSSSVLAMAPSCSSPARPFFELWHFGDRGGIGTARRGHHRAFRCSRRFWSRHIAYTPIQGCPTSSTDRTADSPPLERRGEAADHRHEPGGADPGRGRRDPGRRLSRPHRAALSIVGRSRCRNSPLRWLLARGWSFTQPPTRPLDGGESFIEAVAKTDDHGDAGRRLHPHHRRRRDDLCRHALGIALRPPRPRRQRPAYRSFSCWRSTRLSRVPRGRRPQMRRPPRRPARMCQFRTEPPPQSDAPAD